MVLLCVNKDMMNHVLAGPGSTMMHSGTWHAVTAIEPPVALGVAPTFNPSSGIPVRCYMCKICGYVELYAGSITNPEVWRTARKNV
jgi:hypothetical protein